MIEEDREQRRGQESFELEENEAVVAVRTNTDYDGWLSLHYQSIFKHI